MVSHIFYVHPVFGEHVQFDESFSDALKPPTSLIWNKHFRKMEHINICMYIMYWLHVNSFFCTWVIQPPAWKRGSWFRELFSAIFRLKLIGRWNNKHHPLIWMILINILLMVQISGIHKLRLVVYPIICRVSHIPVGCFRFLPSTVSWGLPQILGRGCLVFWYIVSFETLNYNQQYSLVAKNP